ncbi:MAG: GNAT family protein [Gammaproteobacteria bacterium]|nr:GNAT family protein [Gammaproteobacteria bacterium]
MNTPASIRLIPASTEDAAEFAAMEQEPDTREYIIPYTSSDHRESIQDPNLVYLKIQEKFKTVGFLILALEPDDRSVEFRRVVVSTEGQGIGQAAIKIMEDFCFTNLGRTRVWLDVFEHNHKGQHIYEKLGYRRFQKARHEGKALFLYEKNIATDSA